MFGSQNQRTGLFFGSFNPIHHGHMMLASFILQWGPLDEIWFVVSPHNPLKEKRGLLHELDRYDMVEAAIGDYPKFRVSDIEFRMPQPSYTIDTLVRLSEKYPAREFHLILGTDALQTFSKWKNHERILEFYRIIAYPRKGFDGQPFVEHQSVKLVQAPEIEISSSFVRQALAEGRDMRFFMPDAAYRLAERKGFYKR
ncbi:MAG TPA: nicotinate-nucleotide adenylyltransferase [Bacteroidales bacterium]|nr:nicotinate-nucleotide adenylyltransferase [Bacteroidales bacterium]